MRVRSAWGAVLTCAVTCAIGMVCARIAFEEGSNAASVVTLRCTFAAIAIGIAIRIRGAPDTTTARDRRSQPEHDSRRVVSRATGGT